MVCYTHTRVLLPLLMLLMLPLLSWSQKDNWVLYPRVVGFDAGPSYQAINFSNPSTSLNTPYIVENSVFDEDGDLLFYLQDDMIFDKDGNFEDFYTSGGDIIFYQLMISEVDCTSGAVINDLYDSGATAISSVSQLNFNLAALEINGTTNYFGLNNFIDRCIIVTVEIGNNCGTATDYSYLKFREIEEPQPFWLSSGENAEGFSTNAMNIFPNPATDLLHFRWTTRKDLQGQLVFFDQAGRQVLQQHYGLQAGNQHLVINCSQLTAGTYFYRWQSEQQTFQGKIVKL